MIQRLLQFTRELFEAEPGTPAKTAEFMEKVPFAHALPTHCAIESVAEEVLAPVAFRHPDATREALLSGVLVAYALRRSARRSIGFSVGSSGLAVSAPKSVALRDIDQALREKSGWILRKLHESQARQQRLDATRMEWRDGAFLPYLGAGLQLQLNPALAATALRGLAPNGVPVLGLALSYTAAPDEIRHAVQAWLLVQAKPLFAERLNHFAPQLGVQWRKLSLSSATTRWGSASTNGSIRLNWRLMHFPPAVIDYVIVHELSHLRVMDHSPRFWATVRSVMPDYADLRARLKDESLSRW